MTRSQTRGTTINPGSTPRNRPKRVIGEVEALPGDQLRPATKARDWHVYNEKLVNQGSISWAFKDPGIFKMASIGFKDGRPGYTPTAMAVCSIVRASDSMDWRKTEGRVRDILWMLGWDGPTPDHTTMAKHCADEEVAQALKVFFEVNLTRKARRAGGVTILVDSTGITLCGPGGYLRDKHNDPRRGKYHIMHLATDAATGEILGFKVTESTRCRNPEEHTDGLVCTCPRIGDAPVAEELLTQLVEACVPVEALVGDGAYSGAPLRALAGSLGVRVIAPLPLNASYQPEGKPGAFDRNSKLMLERHLGTKEWKERVKYHVRSSVEADISGLKATMTDRVKAKKFKNAVAELGARVQVRNHWMF